MREYQKIEIRCLNNGSVKEYPIGTTLGEIYEDQKPAMPHGAIVAKANNVTRNLNFCLYKPKEVEFIGIEHESGRRAYIRSLSFILYKALTAVMPGTRLRIEHAISNGFYCRLIDKDNRAIAHTAAQTEAIKAKMNEIIARNLPFEITTIPTTRAMEIFGNDGAIDKVNLLSSLGKLYTQLYRLDGLHDYYDSALAPSTGYVGRFALIDYHDGLLLQMPSAQNPDQIDKYEPQENLFKTYAEHTLWNDLMGLQNAGDLNLKIAENKEDIGGANSTTLLITMAEALQEKKIDKIAEAIVSDPRKKVVLIAGPSSSGKTTFSKKLSIHIAMSGKKPIPFSMDEYFVNREDTPKDEKGEYDFESVYAIDLELFNRQLNQMLNGEEVELPHYNFGTGHREFRGEKIKMEEDSILVIEGIHGLNPELTAQVPDENKFRIYASALTTISLDDHNWIPTTDNRLLRRIVRDYNYRGYSAEDTINRWKSVHLGEEKWIFPFRECADMMFNSALIFEIPVLKRYAEPILAEVPQWSPAYGEARRLLQFLGYFRPIPDEAIPSTSLLREFFGGSSFKQ